MFSFLKRNSRRELNLDEIIQIDLKAAKYLRGLNEEEFIRFIQYEGSVPDSVKLTLYDFLIEFNKLDYCMDKFYRLSQNKELRSVESHNNKVEKASLHHLSNTRQVEKLLKMIDQFAIEDIQKKLVMIKNSIWVRDRISHAIPLWLKKYQTIIFVSYDAVFWNKTYKEARSLKNTVYVDDYYKVEYTRKNLSHYSISYVVKHIDYIKKLFIWMKNLREIVEIENSKF